MKTTPTPAMIAGYKKHCLNGKCKMTPDERRNRKRVYHAAVMANPFRHQQYTDYFRRRRNKPGVRDLINAQARERYHKNIKSERMRGLIKWQKLKADPAAHAAYLERRRKNRNKTNAVRRAQIRHKLIPLWERVVAEGRDEKYVRRTTPENERLFWLWKTNRTLFNQMLNTKPGKRK